MSRWSPVYVPEIETGRHVKNNACTVEIKIKWMIRKHMTYENTYRVYMCPFVWFFKYFWATDNSDHWPFGLSSFRTNDPSDEWPFGLMNLRTNALESKWLHCSKMSLIVIYQSSFITSVINLWNNLDNESRNTRTSDSFRDQYKKKSCTC